jgi:exocyst complex component 4
MNESLDIYSKKDVAAGIQNEVKALLYDYLTGSNHSNQVTGSIFAISEMLKETKKGSMSNDKNIFNLQRFPDESLKKIFQDYCHFTQDSLDKTKELQDQIKDGLETVTTDKFTNVIESGHQLLVPPDASNILVSFKPTIEFMMKIENLIGTKLTNFKVFLDDFIFNVYLPRIQEQVMVYHHANINGIDSFQPDRYPAAEYPLIKVIIVNTEFSLFDFGNTWYL